MNERVAVTFAKAHDKYNAGEVAGFDALIAKRLIEANIATAYDAKAAEAAANAKDAEDAALAQRSADLDAREAALAAREADTAKGAKAAGAPPAQGNTAAKEAV